MGSEVTLIESGKRLLPEADREISQRLGKLLHDAGVTIKRGVEVEAIHQADDGALAVILAEGRGEIAADKVLASRRLPNQPGSGSENWGSRWSTAPSWWMNRCGPVSPVSTRLGMSPAPATEVLRVHVVASGQRRRHHRRRECDGETQQDGLWPGAPLPRTPGPRSPGWVSPRNKPKQRASR